jgi:hypothetical protein
MRAKKPRFFFAAGAGRTGVETGAGADCTVAGFASVFAEVVFLGAAAFLAGAVFLTAAAFFAGAFFAVAMEVIFPCFV